MLPALLCAASESAQISPVLTSAPAGPFRINGNRIVDRDGRSFLLRGTRLAPLSLDEPSNGVATTFSPWSATVFATIRQRLNMNAVALPVSGSEYSKNPEYRARVARVAALANRFELLVVLQSDEAAGETGFEEMRMFWAKAAQQLHANPNLFFGALSTRLVGVIREAGATQPIVVQSASPLKADHSNLIYQVESLSPDVDAWHAPLLSRGLDFELDSPSEDCRKFPADPTQASALLTARLRSFDDGGISWILSSFTPGKLITDYRSFNGTKLDAGWTCAKSDGPPAGFGMAFLSHLWTAKPLGLFAVSESRGGFVVARGGLAHAYGPIFADRDVSAHGTPLPTRLANVSLRVTDSRDVPRPAPLLHTGAGWSSVTFLLPDACAPGPAELAVVRTDGSVSKSRIVIADLAPALLTAAPDGRSVAVGEVVQHAAGKSAKSFPTYRCGAAGCGPTAIHLSSNVVTSIRLLGTGFHHLTSGGHIVVTAGDAVMPVIAAGPAGDPGTDFISVRVPDALKGAGETDVYFSIDGVISNVARLEFR